MTLVFTEYLIVYLHKILDFYFCFTYLVSWLVMKINSKSCFGSFFIYMFLSKIDNEVKFWKALISKEKEFQTASALITFNIFHNII